MSPEEHSSEADLVGVFSRAAATYDSIGPRFFTHLGQRLVELSHLTPGATVLDVAAGRGAVLFAAADQVGPGGRVVGIDLAEQMVRETAADMQRQGRPNVEMHHMSAEPLAFPDASFDGVLCGFALWMFPQPHQALQEVFRVLKPGGRVGLTTWTDDCPFLTWVRRELRSSIPPQAPAAPSAPEAPGFDTPAKLATALQHAGFERLEIGIEDHEFVYATDEDWWGSLWSHGIRSRLERLAPPDLAQVRREMLRKVHVLKQSDGIHTLFRVLFALAYKPSLSVR
jgi:ubiquinone/menaquinone biosynthesis C-methylase UbiE